MVSGGHTHIVYIKDHCEYEIMGVTRDDAAGEAFDKTARILGSAIPEARLLIRYLLMGIPKHILFRKLIWNPVLLILVSVVLRLL